LDWNTGVRAYIGGLGAMPPVGFMDRALVEDPGRSPFEAGDYFA